MKLILSYLVCFIFGFVTLVVYKIQNPTSMNFVKEGRLVENLTALFFFLSFLVALVAILRNKERFFPAMIALAGFMAFGDELEWGRKIIGYKAILYIGKTRIDSIHDFLDPIYGAIKKDFSKIEILILLGILIILFLVIVDTLFKKKKDIFINFLFNKRMFLIGVIGILFVFSFLLDHKNIDLPKNFIFNLNSVILEECSELAGAVALFFLSISTFWDNFKDKIIRIP